MKTNAGLVQGSEVNILFTPLNSSYDCDVFQNSKIYVLVIKHNALDFDIRREKNGNSNILALVTYRTDQDPFIKF